MCYNRPEVIFMTLDRPHARQAFAEYTSHYNAADPKVKLKIDHTYRVAALCERIANSLSLPPQDVDLAWLCGLLHDVGRFEQLRRYGTFIDAKSIDHALMSVTVLFEEGPCGTTSPAPTRTRCCARPSACTTPTACRRRWTTAPGCSARSCGTRTKSTSCG